MRYLDIPTKEGGYHRTGTRTPMQWDNSKNHGFSNASADKLYLPLDPSEDAPTVEDQLKDPSSLLNTVKELTKLRHEHAALQADAEFEVIYAEQDEFPFVFRRGDLIIGINPSEKKATASLPKNGMKAIYSIGDVELKDASLHMQPQSFVILK